MKKVKILTVQWSHNFGAVLQAYALQEKVKQFGFDVEFLNYYNSSEITSSLKPVRYFVHIVWQRIFKPLLGGNRRIKITDEFKGNFLNISSQIYNVAAETKQNKSDCWAHIVGSDQVWNPQITGNPYVYLFGNVKGDTRKIAYAASFGKSNLGQEYYDLFREELTKFHAISVREPEGATLIKELIYSDVDVVLDPTLLLSSEEWKKISNSRMIQQKYILCYYMPAQDYAVTKSIKAIAESLSKKTGYKIINIGKKEFERLKIWENNVFDIGPAEFVSLIMNAEAVVTNSFHGTAFAVNFNVPIYVPINYSVSSRERISIRMEHLLKLVGCEDRIIHIKDSDQIENQDIPDIKMDYRSANEKLKTQMVLSNKFLENALR